MQSGIPMYIPNLPSIPPAFAKLLTEYSGISPDKQHDHIVQLRDRAYQQHPYPCLGRFHFLELDLSVHPLYNTILDILVSDFKTPNASPTVFLDLGCCLGQDLRKLIFDVLGTANAHPPPHPPQSELISRFFGADLRPEFIQIGHDLFQDESKLPKSQFIAPADIFNTSPSAPLAALDGKVSILNCTAVFHLFGLQEQKKVADRCLRLLNPSGIQARESEGKTALVLGAQLGNLTASEHARPGGAKRYRHNDESWRELWEEAVSQSEWKDVVKRVEVGSDLQERIVDPIARDAVREKADADENGDVGQSAEMDGRRRMVLKMEEGFRWQVWWVWVEFY